MPHLHLVIMGPEGTGLMPLDLQFPHSLTDAIMARDANVRALSGSQPDAGLMKCFAAANRCGINELSLSSARFLPPTSDAFSVGVVSRPVPGSAHST